MACFEFEFWKLGFIWDLKFVFWNLCDVILEKKVLLAQSEFYKLHIGHTASEAWGVRFGIF